MKNKEIQLRGGHKLVYDSGDLWKFVTAETWCPISLSYGKDHQIISLDSDGMGMPLLVGCTVSKYIIKAIIDVDGTFCVMLKKSVKDFIVELERGDYIYVVTPNKFGADIKKYVFDHFVEGGNFNADLFTKLSVYDETDKKPKQRFIVLSKLHENIALSNPGGMPIGVVYEDEYQRMFSNVEYAKKYAYDKCQDVIEKLKKQQKEIMKKY